MLPGHSAAREIDTSQDWSRVLVEHGVECLVLDRHGDRDLLDFFRSQPGWTVDFEDGEAAIFVRTDIAQVHSSFARPRDGVEVAA